MSERTEGFIDTHHHALLPEYVIAPLSCVTSRELIRLEGIDAPEKGRLSKQRAGSRSGRRTGGDLLPFRPRGL
jgi:hypothetical protein